MPGGGERYEVGGEEGMGKGKWKRAGKEREGKVRREKKGEEG